MVLKLYEMTDTEKTLCNLWLIFYNLLQKEAKAAKKSWDELGISLNHTIEGNRTKVFQIEKMK